MFYTQKNSLLYFFYIRGIIIIASGVAHSLCGFFFVPMYHV